MQCFRNCTLSSYHYTGQYLQPSLDVVNSLSAAHETGSASINALCEGIDSVYCSVVSTLQTAANIFVPKCRKGFFKFWWDEELRVLKDAAIDSNQAWKVAGKPRYGEIFRRRQSCRSQYRKRIKEKERMSTEMYTNDLHEALMMKNSTAFWQCWRSKFEHQNKCIQVDGHVDPDIIADKFSQHFKTSITCNNTHKAEALKESYLSLRSSYCAMPITESHKFDTELVSNIISDLKRGKAMDVDGLTAEHLQFCHPVVSLILEKLFNLMILCSYVPDGFRYSYIVPIPKPKECYSKSLTCDDFRAIAISPILSKVFEHCIFKRYEKFLLSSDNQFGFKKKVGCSFAIRTVRSIVDSYVAKGSTANLCAIDISKAFDRVNHFALLTKLMKRLIPVQLLHLLESWLLNCYSCVKWTCSFSLFFKLEFGVRQGSVLSPLLFAIYVDDLAKSCSSTRGIYIVLYADDILLLSPTVCELQNVLHMCERELDALDLTINVKKSCCLRIGARNNVVCQPLYSMSGTSLPWVTEIKYLGIHIVNSKSFKITTEQSRRHFYRAANAIFSRIGRIATEEVILHLLCTKCMPILLYGLEACPMRKSDLNSLDFVVNRFFMKLFRTGDINIVKSCQSFFSFNLPSVLIKNRAEKFDIKYKNHGNMLCQMVKYL